LNRLEEGRGSQSRPLGVGAGVEGREGVGAGVQVGAEGALEGGTWEVFADETGREEESDLSVTDGGGGELTEGLADV